MKNFIIFCTLIFCTAAVAQTINWYVDGSVYQTITCNSGDSITPPTPPAKYGYTFQGWKGFTRIEYIESTGRQYIDTEWYFPEAKDSFEINISFEQTTSNRSWVAICGVNNSNNNAANQYYLFQFDASGSHIVAHNTDSASSVQWDVVSGKNTANMYYASDNITTVTYNGVSKTLTGSIYNRGTIPLTLFKNNVFGVNNDTSFSKIRIYAFSIKVNEVFVRDLVPVLDQDSVPCLFDKVSGECFYNAGTGQFVAGPVVSE